MKYWINQNITLEGWKDRAIYAVTPEREHITLSKEERYFLMTCDGREQPYQQKAERLLKASVITCNEAEGKKPKLHLHPTLCRKTAVIAITGRCNYQCRHCFAADGAQSSDDEMSIETLCNLFDQMAELGISGIRLTGGEPMLHPHFMEIVKAIAARSLHLERIFTNGAFLSQESLDQLRQLGAEPAFGISFDGFGTHDWMRCHAGAEARTLEAIDLAVQNGFHVTAHINVNHVTAPGIIETCRRLSNDYGCAGLRLIPTGGSPRWAAMSGPGDEITDDTYNAYFALMLRLFKTAHKEKWGAYLDIADLPDAEALELLKNPPAPKPNALIMHWCRRAKNQIFIGHDGRVLPCGAYEGMSKYYHLLCGNDINIHHRPLKDILTASECVDFCTERIENQLRDVEKCRSCKWAGLCCGGCPAYSALNRRGLMKDNPNCTFYSGGWVERYIDLLEELKSEGSPAEIEG